MPETGVAVAGALRGSWRRDPPPLDRVEPGAVAALVAGGGAGLARWRLTGHGPGTGRPVPPVIEHAWLRQAIEQRRMAARVSTLGPLLGFPPQVLKGCALAARYPAPGQQAAGKGPARAPPGDPGGGPARRPGG